MCAHEHRKQLPQLVEGNVFSLLADRCAAPSYRDTKGVLCITRQRLQMAPHLMVINRLRPWAEIEVGLLGRGGGGRIASAT